MTKSAMGKRSLESKEILAHFRSLLQLDTSNPPGNEERAINYLKDVLDQDGIESTIYSANPGRDNLVAKLSGGTERPIILLSHVDVVGAVSEEWTAHPFGGRVINGTVIGRGTLDTKQLTAMELAAFLALKRSGLPLNRDVYFVATADEEQGSRLGLEYLTRDVTVAWPSAIVISEGGGFHVEHQNTSYMTCTAGEKTVCKGELTISAEPAGKARLESVQRLSSAIQNVSNLRFPMRLTRVGRAFLTALGIHHENHSHPPTRLVDKTDLFLSFLYSYVLYDELEITRIDVQPEASTLRVELQLRLLPGTNVDEMVHCVRQAVSSTGVSCAFQAPEYGYESAMDTPFWDALKEAIYSEGVDAKVLPIYALGRTDGRFLGPNGHDVYGCSPLLPETKFRDVIQLVHNVNECVSVESFLFGARVLTQVLESMTLPNKLCDRDEVF